MEDTITTVPLPRARSTDPLNLLDLDDDALRVLCGGPAFRVRQIKDWLYVKSVSSVAEMSNLPLEMRAVLSKHEVGRLREERREVSADHKTVKWLFRSEDAEIETVLMCYPKRATVCVSVQAGCAQGCPFCATGQSGFQRQLSAGEIVEQVLHAQRELGDSSRRLFGPDHVTNVVFMGMGEPLANYKNMLSALRRLHEDVGLSARSLTVSTIGIPDRIRALAQDAPPVTLAVSLHAPDNRLRDLLVPPNRRWPLREVLAAARDFAAAKGRRVTAEYTLIEGVNDSPAQALALAGLVGPLGMHVNCIPLNSTPDTSYRPSDPETVARFAAVLQDRGVNATVRQTRGRDLDAACGQLRARSRAAAEATRQRSQVTGAR